MKKILRCVIIDDEKNSVASLQELIVQFCDQTEVVGTANDVQEGVKVIRKYNPDIVFLDIEMPMENGFRLLDYFDSPTFEVIFTTAYDQYAIQAFKVSALDYLLKPIYLKDLKNSLDKARQKRDQSDSYFALQERYFTLKENLVNPWSRIALPSTEGYEFVATKDIIFCQSDSNYSHVYLVNGKKIMLSKTLKKVHESLDPQIFLRVHNSFVVNKSHIAKFTKTKTPVITMSDGTNINISASYKERFYRIVENLK
ncbi:MAG: LytTR family DNA-binding domain-containing protein [Bacteroidota bacterium]